MLGVVSGFIVRCGVWQDQDPPIIHRDVKASNVLVDESWSCVISDFGLTRDEVADTMTTCGTYLYLAPEVTCLSVARRSAVLCRPLYCAVLLYSVLQLNRVNCDAA